MNLLSFRLKTFGFDRSATIGGSSYALFQRTETESESKLRPKLIRLWVVVPVDWLVLDEAAESIVIAPDGVHPGPQGKGTALEAAAEAEEFSEQGVAWRRRPTGADRILYVPAPRAGELFSPVGLRSLGLGE